MPTIAASGNDAVAASLERIAELLERLDTHLTALLPALPQNVWTALAYRWRRHPAYGRSVGVLEPIVQVARIEPSDLRHVDRQKEALLRNTAQFVQRLPANNVLLTGARGTGKSSLIRACLAAYGQAGLRLIEVDKLDLIDLPEIAALIASRPERYILFCDDLSFEEGESSYKALKAALDGSLASAPANLLIYATSNRRHLMPEFMRENLASTYDADGQLHPAETVDEKVSLSERFGLWLSFYPFAQDAYWDIAAHWLRHYGLAEPQVAAARDAALQFALTRASRSGRVAQQFARDYAGRATLAVGPR